MTDHFGKVRENITHSFIPHRSMFFNVFYRLVSRLTVFTLVVICPI